MKREYFYGARRKRASVVPAGPMPGPRHFQGTRVCGRVARLLTGQGFGFIRLANDRDVFFHRADLKDGTLFNDLNVGDAVLFELFEDAVSGPRALGVARRSRFR
jgi:cold shock CspA family protein